jgi:hypothetical protein
MIPQIKATETKLRTRIALFRCSLPYTFCLGLVSCVVQSAAQRTGVGRKFLLTVNPEPGEGSYAEQAQKDERAQTGPKKWVPKYRTPDLTWSRRR